MIWMDVDIALSEVPVNISALIDNTDFKTREEAITYDQEGMDLAWNFVTTGGAFTQTAVTPTTAGVHDWTNQGNGMYSIEIPDTGGTINNDTEGFGWFTGYCTGVLPWTGPVIGFRAAGLNDKLIDSAYSATQGLAGTDLDANIAGVETKIDTLTTTVGAAGVGLTEAGGDGDHLTEAGGTGDHLTAINLPNQTMDITGNITGNLSGSVGSVTGAVGSVTAEVSADVTKVSGDATAADTLELFCEILNQSTGQIDNGSMDTTLDVYQAKTWLIDDDTGSADRYITVWAKNGEFVTSGITSPTIQVIKIADGTDLVGSTAMTEIGSLGLYRHDESTNRIVAGAGYIAKTQATIGAATRTWFQPVGRDS